MNEIIEYFNARPGLFLGIFGPIGFLIGWLWVWFTDEYVPRVDAEVIEPSKQIGAGNE
jgi:hypothetical protein